MDVSKYIGIPYKTHGRSIEGVDCWGLIVLIYNNELNIELPSFTDKYKSVKDSSLKKLVNEQKQNWIQTDGLKIFNVALIRSEPYHIGLLINSAGDMVHSMFGRDTCIENIYGVEWKNRIEGIFEYA